MNKHEKEMFWKFFWEQKEDEVIKFLNLLKQALFILVFLTVGYFFFLFSIYSWAALINQDVCLNEISTSLFDTPESCNFYLFKYGWLVRISTSIIIIGTPLFFWIRSNIKKAKKRMEEYFKNEK